MLFIQQSIVGFDEFMKVQAGRVRHYVFVVIRIVFNLKSFGFDLRFGIIPLHILFIEKKTRSVGSLALGSACVNWNVGFYSSNIASYLICLDVICSNISNHRRLVSVPVPRITCVSLLCYRFQSERITETAKPSNVVNYLDSILSRPGLLKPNRDILASRRQRSGFRDRVSKTGTVPEKPGRLVSLGNAGWCEIANSIFSIFFFCTGKFILT